MFYTTMRRLSRLIYTYFLVTNTLKIKRQHWYDLASYPLLFQELYFNLKIDQPGPQ